MKERYTKYAIQFVLKLNNAWYDLPSKSEYDDLELAMKAFIKMKEETPYSQLKIVKRDYIVEESDIINTTTDCC